MQSRRATTRSGFTFIEILVALAVAAIGLLGLLRLHLLSTAVADSALDRTQAVFVGQERTAEVTAGGFPRQGTESGSVERNGRDFAWRTETTNVGSAETGDLKLTGLRQVRTIVRWQTGTGEKEVQMTTYVADSRIHESTTR